MKLKCIEIVEISESNSCFSCAHQCGSCLAGGEPLPRKDWNAGRGSERPTPSRKYLVFKNSRICRVDLHRICMLHSDTLGWHAPMRRFLLLLTKGLATHLLIESGRCREHLRGNAEERWDLKIGVANSIWIPARSILGLHFSWAFPERSATLLLCLLLRVVYNFARLPHRIWHSWYGRLLRLPTWSSSMHSKVWLESWELENCPNDVVISWNDILPTTWNYSEFLSAMICRTQILLDAGLPLVWSWWLLEGLLSIKQDEVSTIKSRWARKSLPYSAPVGKAYANDCCKAMTFCPFNFNILFIPVHLTLLDMSSLMHHTPGIFPSTESHCLSCGQIWCGPGQDHEHRRTSHDDAGRATHIRPRWHDHLNIL